ncbi:DgyrCDS9886 [Dimorphilus gyrociliatus]|uniref:DgyrCDS9886 n=1 Tax=Dimorphilus gyrociliatus TaxID=2664684 RepID=A0A7I8VZM7_9ANNE|nr:DgyrCDS9886 [Dimorphilus gyrociliatus]
MKRMPFHNTNSDSLFRPRFQPFRIKNPQQVLGQPIFRPPAFQPSAFVRYRQLQTEANNERKTSTNIQQNNPTSSSRKSSTDSKVQIKRTRLKSDESKVKRTKERTVNSSKLTTGFSGGTIAGETSQEDCSALSTHHDDAIQMNHNFKFKNRRWHKVINFNEKIKYKKAQQFIDFSIASYNLLAQNLLEDNRYLYKHCEDWMLSWDYRRNKLIEELSYRRSDILCLQEVNAQHYESFFKPEIERLGYDSLFKKRTNDKQDGCATFWRRSLFRMINHKLIEFNRVSDDSVMDRDNIAIIVMLESTNEKFRSRLCVANTHLLYNPRRGDIKLAQLMILLAEIEFMTRDRRRYPIILCGDFNAVPFSNIYNFIDKGRLEVDHVETKTLSGQDEQRNSFSLKPQLGRDFISKRLNITDQCCFSNDESSMYVQDSGLLKHHLNLKSAYRHLIRNERGGKVMEATTSHRLTNQTVDYIFYNVAEKKRKKEHGKEFLASIEGNLQLLSTLRLPTVGEMNDWGRLPNACISSDHVLLMARFLLIANE